MHTLSDSESVTSRYTSILTNYYFMVAILDVQMEVMSISAQTCTLVFLLCMSNVQTRTGTDLLISKNFERKYTGLPKGKFGQMM